MIEAVEFSAQLPAAKPEHYSRPVAEVIFDGYLTDVGGFQTGYPHLIVAGDQVDVGNRVILKLARSLPNISPGWIVEPDSDRVRHRVPLLRNAGANAVVIAVVDCQS